jgi:uncharacterized membrane protein
VSDDKSGEAPGNGSALALPNPPASEVVSGEEIPLNHVEIPSKSKSAADRTTTSIRTSSGEFRMSVGVLTDPRSLAEYEQAVPGSGKAILDKFFQQTEREVAHRHAMEREAMQHELQHDQSVLKQGDRGQWLGLIVALAGFILVAFFVQQGHPNTAAAFGAATLITLVSAFIYGRRKQTEEMLAEKQQEAASSAPQLPKTATPPK